jgi:hypothetical protein
MPACVVCVIPTFLNRVWLDVQQRNNTPKTDQLLYLERSLIYFLENFRRIYIGDQALAKSTVYQKLSDTMGLTTHSMYLDAIIRKVYGDCLAIAVA